MNISINPVGVNPDSKLEEFVNARVSKLLKFNDSILNVEVFLRVRNTQSGENKIVEIKVEIPKTEFFAKKVSKTFEESTDAVIEALRRQMVKHKEKIRAK